MIRIFRMEARHSPLRWALVAFIAIDIAALFGRSRFWIGVWPEASAAAQIPAFFLGPALAAGAAWVAARNSRKGVPERLSGAVISGWRVDAAQLASTVCYGLAAYAVGVAAAAVVSFRQAGPGFVWPGYVLLGAAILIGCASFGHAAGRLTRSRLVTPVACALGTFILLGSIGNPNAVALFVLSGPPQAQTSVVAVAARFAGAFSLLVLAVALPSVVTRGELRWPPSRRQRGTALAGAGAVLLSTALVVGVGPLQVERPAPPDAFCSSAQPRVCLWPEHRKYLPEILALVERLQRLPASQFTLPGAFYERGLRDSAAFPQDFMITEGSTWSVSPALAGAILQQSAPWCATADPGAAARRDQATFELTAWLEAWMHGAGQPGTVHGGPPGVDLTEIATVVSRPEPEQAQWSGERVRLIRDTPCDG